MPKGSFVKLQSFARDVIKDIETEDERLRMKAARYVRVKMRQKISRKVKSGAGQPPGRLTGNLRKGLVPRKYGKYTNVVGQRAPHGHLLEFGRKKSTTASRMEPRPYFVNTFMEERGEIIRILSKERV